MALIVLANPNTKQKFKFSLWFMCESTTDVCTILPNGVTVVCFHITFCVLCSGVMRSVLQALMVRIVKVCVTAPMAHAATTLMEAVFVSRASVGHTAGTGCVNLANMAYTVNAHVSAKTNTHSGE